MTHSLPCLVEPAENCLEESLRDPVVNCFEDVRNCFEELLNDPVVNCFDDVRN